ncbi:MAG: hypothetical protein RSC43_00405 [Clostridia bacterium]
MDVTNLVEELHQRFPASIQKFGKNKGQLSRNVIPVLINYRPIVSYIHGKRCYAYLNLNTEDIGICYMYSRRSTSEPFRFYDADENLSTLLSDYDKPVYLKQLSNFMKNTLHLETFAGNMAEVGATVEGNMALNITTLDFESLRMLAGATLDSSATILGVTIPLYLTTTTGETVSAPMIVRKWYDSYMLQANIELGVLYMKSIPRNSNYPYLRRFLILNEFVPLIVKLDGVYNPLTDLPDVWNDVARRYPLFSKLERASSSKYSTDSTAHFDATEEPTKSCVYFTLRGSIQKLFNIDVAPSSASKDDGYSFEFYASILLGLVQSALPETFQILEGEMDWYAFATIHQDLRELIKITPTDSFALNEVSHNLAATFKAHDASSRLTGWQRAACYSYAIFLGMDPFDSLAKYDFICNAVAQNATALRLATFTEVI